MHGFQNNLAQLFSLKGRIAILNFCRGRLKVKVTLGGRSGGVVEDNMLDRVQGSQDRSPASPVFRMRL